MAKQKSITIDLILNRQSYYKLLIIRNWLSQKLGFKVNSNQTYLYIYTKLFRQIDINIGNLPIPSPNGKKVKVNIGLFDSICRDHVVSNRCSLSVQAILQCYVDSFFNNLYDSVHYSDKYIPQFLLSKQGVIDSPRYDFLIRNSTRDLKTFTRATSPCKQKGDPDNSYVKVLRTILRRRRSFYLNTQA